MEIAILDSESASKGWFRGGNNIYYYKSNVDHIYYKS